MRIQGLQRTVSFHTRDGPRHYCVHERGGSVLRATTKTARQVILGRTSPRQPLEGLSQNYVKRISRCQNSPTTCGYSTTAKTDRNEKGYHSLVYSACERVRPLEGGYSGLEYLKYVQHREP
eukprot:1177477-Prorocentrum_minimum.AAC.1